GALHFENGAIPANEPIMVTMFQHFLGQAGLPVLWLRVRGERKIERRLLVEDGKQPILKLIRTSRRDSMFTRYHLLAAGADGFGHLARFEEAAVEGREEDL